MQTKAGSYLSELSEIALVVVGDTKHFLLQTQKMIFVADLQIGFLSVVTFVIKTAILWQNDMKRASSSVGVMSLLL